MVKDVEMVETAAKPSGVALGFTPGVASGAVGAAELAGPPASPPRNHPARGCSPSSARTPESERS
jgi:hypothetical protein